MGIPSIGGSFVIANQGPKYRLVVALDGIEKQGKTHFALTAPGPLAYQGWDIGDEGVVEKFQTEKVVHRADYWINVEKDDSPEEVIKKVMPEWKRFITDFKTIVVPKMKGGQIRTCIWDTGSEVWDALRLARMGKLTQIMPLNYMAFNMEYRSLVRAIYDTPGNLIILHKLKSEWKENPLTGKSAKTGGYERAGYSDTGFLVQVNALAWREENPETKKKTGPFHVTITDCRQNPKAAGVDLSTDLDDSESLPMATFQWLAVNVYPETSLEDWE